MKGLEVSVPRNGCNVRRIMCVLCCDVIRCDAGAAVSPL